ncbi:MAG: hypothetical protein H6869_09025 [Rhodospirillales bacterium]|nr:hypothetical protein [Rhodospirillales bacterium]
MRFAKTLRSGLSAVFRFFAEARADRMERYRDFRKETERLDRYDDQELFDTIDRDAYVKVSEVLNILKRVRNREAYRFSCDDFDEHAKPVFDKLFHEIEWGGVDCRIMLEEELKEDARVKAGDILNIIAAFELPSGRDDDPKATEEIAVAVTPAFAKGKLGEIQQRVNEVAPIRTPSVEVEYKREQASHALNVYRPLILAVGLAALYRDETRAIEAGNIPSYKETRMERQTKNAKSKPPQHYRGVRVDR